MGPLLTAFRTGAPRPSSATLLRSLCGLGGWKRPRSGGWGALLMDGSMPEGGRVTACCFGCGSRETGRAEGSGAMRA